MRLSPTSRHTDQGAGERGAGSPRVPVPTVVPGWEAGGEKPQPLPGPLVLGLPKAVGGWQPVPGVSRQPAAGLARRNAISHSSAVNYRASVQSGVRHEGAFVRV